MTPERALECDKLADAVIAMLDRKDADRAEVEDKAAKRAAKRKGET